MKDSLVSIILESKIGFSQNPIYYFTNLKDASKILSSGKLYTSSTRIAGDRRENRPDRYVSFTKNPDFADGYPYNTDIDHQKKKNVVKRGKQIVDFEPDLNKFGDIQYHDKDQIAVVRFEIDTDILESLIDQVVEKPLAEPFEFNLVNIKKKPEQEERLWLLIQQIDDFPRCIKSVCFNRDYSSETDYMNKLARKVFAEAKKCNIPCFERGFNGKEYPVSATDHLYGPSASKSWKKGKNDTDPFGGKYDEFVKVAAVCCLRKFGKNRQSILSYLSRLSSYLEGEKYHQFLLDVEQQVEEYFKDPVKLNDFSQEDDWVLGKQFKGDKDLQHELSQMVYRSQKQAGVNSFTQLCTARRNQIETNDLKEELIGFIEETRPYNVDMYKFGPSVEDKWGYGYTYRSKDGQRFVKSTDKIDVTTANSKQFSKSPEALRAGYGYRGDEEQYRSERIVDRYLRQSELSGKYERQYHLPGSNLSLDFYFPNLLGPGRHAAIEVCGPSHRLPGEEGFKQFSKDPVKQQEKLKKAENQREDDIKKKEYCKNAGILLRFIPGIEKDEGVLPDGIRAIESLTRQVINSFNLEKKTVTESKDFNFEDYILEGWMHREARSLEYDDSVYDLLEVPDSTVLQAVADYAFDKPIPIEDLEEDREDILAFILTDLSKEKYDPEAESVGGYLKAQVGPRFN